MHWETHFHHESQIYLEIGSCKDLVQLQWGWSHQVGSPGHEASYLSEPPKSGLVLV